MLLAQSIVLTGVACSFFLVIGVLYVLVFAMIFSPWLRAGTSGVPISVLRLIAMKLRRTDVDTVIGALIVAKQGGVAISCEEMENAWNQGVDLEKVTLAMVQAARYDIEVTFEQLVDAEMSDRLAEMLRPNEDARPEEELAYS